jgi:hypothetical protein
VTVGLTIEVISEDMTAAAEWRTFTYTEQIGQPDRMSVNVVGFKTDPLFTAPVEERLTNPNDYFYSIVRLDDDILFTGLVRGVVLKKPAQGAMGYQLTADGWAFLLPRRLVGVPNGENWFISAEAALADEPPDPVNVDPVAEWFIAPTPAGIATLFGTYWNYPWPIDLTSFVTDVLPEGASGDEMKWSGSDMEGVLNDLAAAGSASARWWFANDSPLNLWLPGHPAEKLALHFGIIVVPDPGEDVDDLLLGFPSADIPENVAPYAISDTPDGITSILATDLSFAIDHMPRADATYIRGATGYIYEEGGVIKTGGTGWVGTPGGIWGEEYTDAPAAVSEEQRDAFGNAFLASRDLPSWTGTVEVVGYDGWHKGQIISVTDADYGFSDRWFLILGVTMTQNDPQSIANKYVLTLGDVLTPSLGYELREQRLREQRKEVDPGAKFTVYHGDLLLDPTDPDNSTSKIEGQFATASGTARKVKGVGARWHLWINGVDQGTDIHNHGSAYFLHAAPALSTVTDELGKVYGVLEAGASALPSDAADISIDVVLP